MIIYEEIPLNINFHIKFRKYIRSIMVLAFRSTHIRLQFFSMNVTVRIRVRNYNTTTAVAFTRHKCLILIYCPIANMKKFIWLMLHFHRLKSPWRRADILRYGLSSKKMIAQFENIGERKKRKPLQRNHWNKAIAKWCHFFLSWILPCSYIAKIQTIWFLFGKFLTYPGNKYNNNYFFETVLGILLPVIVPTS